MTKEEFIELFIEELEIEDTSVTLDTELDSIDEWDSMAVMVTIGLAADNFGTKLTNDDIKSLTTVNSLIEKIGLDKFSS